MSDYCDYSLISCHLHFLTSDHFGCSVETTVRCRMTSVSHSFRRQLDILVILYLFLWISWCYCWLT